MTGTASDRAEPSLREYIEAEIRHLRELREEDLKAQRIHAMEVERRLVALNGEAGRIQTVLGQTLNREVFQTYKDGTDKALLLAVGKAQGVVSVGQVITWVVGIAVAALLLWDRVK